ncbi:MAG: hypothetical protein E7294_11210 [Lachnospiraceae bacterium]|nr:hypothetical protein [Lachnospiraceae bacterium]
MNEETQGFYKKVLSLTGIHFIAGMAYRRYLYHYDEEATQYYNLPRRVRETFLSGYEKQISMCISSLIGIVLIFAIWYILIKAVKEKRKGVFVILLISILSGALLYPNCFGIETDTFEMYGMAVRDIPHYWHSVYSTCIYNAGLLVYPQPVILPILQISALLGTLYYLALRLKKLFGKYAFFLPWVLLLFPGMLQIAVSTYRNCINTIMCMAFFSLVFCDAVEKKKRTGPELAILCACAAFLTVYRSEQIFLLLIFAAALWFVYEARGKKIGMYALIMLLACVIFILPQKQGEKVYYGKDYSIINQLDTLSMLFREKDLDLNYDKAKEDLQALEAIVPVEKIKNSGLSGYRGHVYTQNGSINQSFADKESQTAFIKASRSIILHNIPLYLKARIQTFFTACGLQSEREINMTDEINAVYDSYGVSVTLAQKQMYEDTWLRDLLWTNEKTDTVGKVMDLYESLQDWIERNGILLTLRAIVFLVFAVIVYTLCKERIFGKEKGFWLAALLFFYAQLAGIFLMCPEGRKVYYYPLFFTMLIGNVVLILYYLNHKPAGKEKKEKSE